MSEIDTSVYRPDEDPLLLLSGKVAEFAGYYCSSGDLYVGITPGSDETADSRLLALVAEANVARLCYHREEGLRPPTTKLVPMTYDFLSLRSWRDGMSEDFFHLSGAIGLGIDYQQNRVVMILREGTAHAAAGSLALSAGVPSEAFIIRAEDHPQNTTACPSSIDGGDTESCFRPVPGGVRLQPGPNGGTSSLGICTFGAAGSRLVSGVWQPGYITNSHCTPPTAINNSDWISQPNWPGGLFPNARVVGVETFDPPVFTCGGVPCRESESAWITDTAGSYHTGTILQTLGWTGSKIRSTSNPRFYIWNAVTAVQGMQVEKVGASSGWTSGTVTGLCYDTINGDGIKIRCTTFTSLSATGGDSGAPVFYWWWFYGVDTVEFVGILWGKNSSHTFHSPWNKVNQDLGPLYIIWPGF